MIVTRSGPDLTGKLFIGAARSILLNFAFAKAVNGKFILRIDDTDRLRWSSIDVSKTIEMVKWLGIIPDDIVVQSKHQGIYQEYANRLIKNNLAYICSCNEVGGLSSMKQGLKAISPCECANNVVQESNKIQDSNVVKLRCTGNGYIQLVDIFQGRLIRNRSEINDFIILKSGGEPTYHLANVIDDYLMGITHSLRGLEGIESAFKQSLIYEGLDIPSPQIGHFGIIENINKLPGATIYDLKTIGYSSIAISEYLLTSCFKGGCNNTNATATLATLYNVNSKNVKISIFDLDRFNKKAILLALRKPRVRKEAIRSIDTLFHNEHGVFMKRNILRCLVEYAAARVRFAHEINPWIMHHFLPKEQLFANFRIVIIEFSSYERQLLINILTDVQRLEVEGLVAIRLAISMTIKNIQTSLGKKNFLGKFRYFLTGISSGYPIEFNLVFLSRLGVFKQLIELISPQV